jgi:pimeloyl-ACP methyl ester carboxylesterase
MANLLLPGYAQAVHALGRGDLLADAARIALPTLIACGEQDAVTPPDYARQVHQAIPGSRLRMVAECGHVLPQEAPEEAAAMLAELADG